MALDPALSEPMYRQLFDQLAERIGRGTLPPGFRLPPSRALARELGVHRTTAVRAYEELEAAGFVTATVGRGTFVADVPPAGATREVGDDLGETTGLPWDSLVTAAVAPGRLQRFERLQRRVGRRSADDPINLTRMQPGPDLVPEQQFRRCLEHVLRTRGGQILGYADRDGEPRLRAAIAADLQRRGVPADPGDILVTSGSQQAIDILARALVGPGDTFLVDECTYTGALDVLSCAGARLVAVPSDDDGPDLIALERLARSGAKGLYLMPNGNNPTGACISAERRRKLVGWSRRSAIPLIEDDYAADLLVDGQLPAALRALDREVLHLGTYSKRLIPALRIGYLVCPPALRPRLTMLKHAMDLGCSKLLQHALAEFLERGYFDAHLARVDDEYRRRRDALETALRAHLPAQMTWHRPRAGVTLWLPLPPPLTAEQVFEEAQRQGVLVSPGTLNRSDGSAGTGVRLVFCNEPGERLVVGAERLARAIRTALRDSAAAPHEPPTLGTV